MYSPRRSGYDDVRRSANHRVVNEPSKSADSPYSYREQIPHFLREQQVEVRINANVWVMGIIIGILKMCSSYAGATYQVAYISPGGTHQQREFDSDHIRYPSRRE
ncbi:hypothetical protein NM688_g1505 [Phlebia brevispora]|uniref:Uncharacterized protein n=1 Tax=Phlebia brevispora TaxID=194682 RepID=A0ACC1TBH8_9APHY|nr:hypothetical protein NM688_g1505 [Phlebia brevispora]